MTTLAEFQEHEDESERIMLDAQQQEKLKLDRKYELGARIIASVLVVVGAWGLWDVYAALLVFGVIGFLNMWVKTLARAIYSEINL